MKKISFILIFYCILIYGCKKETDYRDKFLGNYNFIVHIQGGSGLPPNYTITDTTYNYNGKVELGAKDNTVLIYFSEKSPSYYFLERIIYEDGTFYYGEFESTTKIKFHIWNHAPGYNYNYDITGEKE